MGVSALGGPIHPLPGVSSVPRRRDRADSGQWGVCLVRSVGRGFSRGSVSSFPPFF